jgi:alpha-1,6-mannosyltransferase
MRIVRLANYVAPHSGGLRTSLRELGAGYLAAGHQPVLIIPGERDGDEQTPQGRVITLSGPRLPFTGGYRVLLRQRRVAALLGAPARRAAAGHAGGVRPDHAALDRAVGARARRAGGHDLA